MKTCIGCKCCVVACNEQNGNPASINWRRVAEIEGGWYPEAQRFYLSMGCNHCVEPTCLSGCPVDAYSKDALTGFYVDTYGLSLSGAALLTATFILPAGLLRPVGGYLADRLALVASPAPCSPS